MTEKKYRVHDWVKFQYSEIGEYIGEDYTDKPLRNDEIVDLLNNYDEVNKSLSKELQYGVKKVQRLAKENEHLKQQLDEVIEVCRQYGIYKEELQYVLSDYDKILKEKGERGIKYKYFANSR